MNPLKTVGLKKQEFFFNKKNLMMTFRGMGELGNEQVEYYIDNLKLYETDMVPFFQYYLSPISSSMSFVSSGNINLSVQQPNIGISPIIDATDSGLIENGEDNNAITTMFKDELLPFEVEIPNLINWENDYALFRTQLGDIQDVSVDQYLSTLGTNKTANRWSNAGQVVTTTKTTVGGGTAPVGKTSDPYASPNGQSYNGSNSLAADVFKNSKPISQQGF